MLPIETTPGNGEQKVTNATVALKIDHLSERISGVLDRLDKLDATQREDHDTIKVLCNDVETHGKEIEKVRSKYDLIGTINGVGTLIAGVLGALGMRQ